MGFFFFIISMASNVNHEVSSHELASKVHRKHMPSRKITRVVKDMKSKRTHRGPINTMLELTEYALVGYKYM